MAGVVGLPEASNINGCDDQALPLNPAESAGNPQDCRTSEPLSRAEIVRRLEDVADITKTGNVPEFLAAPNDWAPALSQLAARAAEIIRRGTDPRIEMESGDVVKICGIRYSMGLFHHIGLGPTDQFYQIVEDRQNGLAIIRVFVSEHSEIDRRLETALIGAGGSALGMPSSVDTFKPWLESVGLGLVLVPARRR